MDPVTDQKRPLTLPLWKLYKVIVTVYYCDFFLARVLHCTGHCLLKFPLGNSENPKEKVTKALTDKCWAIAKSLKAEAEHEQGADH